MRIPTVAVSGGFDPVHRGHIELFRYAKSLGEVYLILNNDDFLTQKKGKPFMPLQERYAVLSSIRYIDHVVIAIDTDMTVCKTLEIIKPDIFLNGGDRNEEKAIPEAEVCKRCNIKMVFSGQPKIQSSSWLLKQYEN